MAVDPLNSVGGYTVGIPPVPVIDSNGNITANQATIGNVTITGDQVVTGNIVANLFVGSFSGNISGNLITPGGNGWVLFNDNSSAASNQNFQFDAANNAGGNAFTTFSTEGQDDIVANSRTSQLTFVAQTGIAIGLNPENSTISIATNTFGASNLAVDFGAVTDILGSVTFDYGYVQ